MDERRPYRMTARADRTAATHGRILDATVESFWADPSGGWTLDDVARRAGVTVQTIIRHFGTRDGLMGSTAEREAAAVAAERNPSRVTDAASAVAQLADHYERLGDRVLRMLSEEQRSPTVAAIAARGRAFHRAWCERVFGSTLAALRPEDRPRRLAQLVAVCDVYTWKILRRDAGLSRADTHVALLELLQPLTEGS